jgi:NAD+ synthase (glutamine-hydrolysing)
MASVMRVAIAQQNPIVGDLAGNTDRLLAVYTEAQRRGADLVVAPELVLTGYPPRDLLDRPSFVREAVAAIARVARTIQGPPLIVGSVVSDASNPLALSDRLANGAVAIERGTVVACHRKMLLPTYDVFDEARYFVPGQQATVVHLAGVNVGLSVCEDAWNDKEYWHAPRYERDPLAEEAGLGAGLLINLSASPYDRGKAEERFAMLRATAQRHRLPLLYANQVGGNDSLLFDGRSLAVDAEGRVSMLAPAFAEALSFAEIDGKRVVGELTAQPESWEADVTAALQMGLTDYVRKCGFRDVVVGLSGGIDSALTAALAVRALGPGHVIGVAMPSRYSSSASLEDAKELAGRLDIRFEVVAIEPMFHAYLEALAGPFSGYAPDVTEENLQARIRGALLMAFSNKLGSLLLTTGNKSELATGYCTLYGDMCGGLAVISDLYKTQVYAIARYINASSSSPPIPESSLTKPPSAELRPNQTDQDSLPPYPELDAVLEGYIEGALGEEALVARGLDDTLARQVARLVDMSEYKRRQMPPGLRVSRKAFGEGRRIPLAQAYSR